MSDIRTPKTLLEAVRYFSDENRTWLAFVNQRWSDGNVTCPRCNCERVHLIASRKVWRCNGCRRQFSVKVGTIFEDSPLPLTKWLPAMWLITNAKNGISSCELHRALGVTQKTAWFMLHRIRLAMQDDSIQLLGGKDGVPVEVDETFIGGKARFMHASVKEARGITTAPMSGKEVVLGILERGKTVRTFHVGSTKRKALVPTIKQHVALDSWLFSDANPSYVMLPDWFRHETVDHAVEYVSGQVHTNGMENYWSLLKRTLKGTYVSVEPFHLFRYLDEQSFRYNERKLNDSERFQAVTASVVGRRLTYRQLTGKELAAGCAN